ncbi:ubiquinol-cytochrome c reductase iron-sulfur subunit [Litoreibacter halocynthiae]|uniref:Ubiquinol-cytochrome c reductase iron-sulfur subunit n=1 Tax=Litoreibacter halocynthiae TaxID=1242689 RepID=A0A4V3EVN6_9RHOB|nr:ubiquinol-cytochrome c reductase iron-sulfur subunit [Litoreibacter halocynthiae]TDT72685.1 ubiquinol-cytochrome c reductase iron-sulfur subunit [Litoreibacter halocynthiae]
MTYTSVASLRRDFLYHATAGAGVIATGAAVWPLLNQMNPSADVRALTRIDVDISDLQLGTQLTVSWRGKPVFIRYRTEQEINASRSEDVSELPDTNPRNLNVTSDALASDENRSVQGHEQFLVMIGVCTHLGCVPLGDGAGDFGGWFCPCHGSHYDTAGRIRKGPAPENLHIPEISVSDDMVLTLG